jgi:hypothetical protein
MNLGRSWWTVASLAASLASFYLTTWEEYHTGHFQLLVGAVPNSYRCVNRPAVSRRFLGTYRGNFDGRVHIPYYRSTR